MVAEKKPARAKRAATKPKDEDIFISPEEGRQIFDEAARKYMHMSGEEFLRAWNAGEIENPDRPEVMNVYMLLPLVR